MAEDNQKPNEKNNEDGEISIVIKPKVGLPKKYKVLLHNDDYTTMEFVIFILQIVFHKTLEEAEKIMLEVHQKGNGVCGVFTFDIAQSKSNKVGQLAQEYGHPLLSSIEPE